MLTTTLMFVLLSVAVWTDMREHKIYNWTTYMGMASAIVIATLNTYCSESKLMQQLLGWNGSAVNLEDAALGLFVCGGVVLACYVFFSIGGGDVKLLAMLGAFLGLDAGIKAMLWTFILGGAMALVIILWTTDFRKLSRRFVTRVRSIILLQSLDRGDDTDSVAARPLYLAPSALLATILVRFELVDRWGWI